MKKNKNLIEVIKPIEQISDLDMNLLKGGVAIGGCCKNGGCLDKKVIVKALVSVF